MGWRTQENYERKAERDFARLPWRDRQIFRRVGWAAALIIVFVIIVGTRIR